MTFTRNIIRTLMLSGLLIGRSVYADTYLIDVRTPEEYAEAHADGAQNIPYDDIGTAIGNLTADKQDTIYLYCRSGRRAEIATETLHRLGYQNVTNLGTLEKAAAAQIDLDGSGSK